MLDKEAGAPQGHGVGSPRKGVQVPEKAPGAQQKLIVEKRFLPIKGGGLRHLIGLLGDCVTQTASIC